MKNYQAWTLVAVVAMLCASAVVIAQPTANRAQPTKVAVVDVRRVFNSLAEKDQIEADLNTMQQRMVEENTARQNELRKMVNDLQMIGSDDRDHDKLVLEIEQARYNLENWGKWQQNMLLREERLRTLSLYRKIILAVEKSGQIEGYDLVLYKEHIDLDNIRPDEVSTLITTRRVLWSKDSMDLTDTVITQMNNEFRGNVR